MDSDKQFERYVFWSAIFVYLITAINSVGYYHPDEHYQIIEFAQFKLGETPASELAWEFHARIRPTLQPSIAFLLIGGLKVISVTSAYAITLIFRLLTAVLALWVLKRFTTSWRRYFDNTVYWKWFLILTYFLWCIPWINVHYSAETLSGLTFLWGLSIVIEKESDIPYLKLGAILGLAFLFKFQSLLLTFGLFLWLIFNAKATVRSLLLLIAGFVVLSIIGVAIDSWYYGEFTISAWNYVNSNLVEGAASSFGESPWFSYFKWTFKKLSMPIAILFYISLIILFVRKRSNVLLWCLVPYVLIHCLIGHKELRFMFPIVNFLPLIIALAIQQFDLVKFVRTGWKKYSTILVATSLILINVLALTVSAVTPAGNGNIYITNFINSKYSGGSARLIIFEDTDPYNSVKQLRTSFYEKGGPVIEREIIGKIDDLTSIPIEKNPQLLVVKQNHLKQKGVNEELKNLGFRQKIKGYPGWTDPLLSLYGNFKKGLTYVLYVRD